MNLGTCEVKVCHVPAVEVMDGGARVCEPHSHADHYRRWHCKFCDVRVGTRRRAIAEGDHHKPECERWAPPVESTSDAKRVYTGDDAGHANPGTEEEAEMPSETFKDQYGLDQRRTIVTTSEEVTEEIVEATIETCDGWFPDGPIDWEAVWDRMEGQHLADGSELSWGEQFDTPAMRKVQRNVREYRRAAG